VEFRWEEPPENIYGCDNEQLFTSPGSGAPQSAELVEVAVALFGDWQEQVACAMAALDGHPSTAGGSAVLVLAPSDLPLRLATPGRFRSAR
jgi:hypothetical protein